MLTDEAVEQFSRFILNNISDVKKYIEEHQEEYEKFIREEELEENEKQENKSESNK